MTTDTPHSQPPRASAEGAADADGSALTKDEYAQLAQLRYSLREFARATEVEARAVGITPQQYQLLLAIKGFPGREQANISELAERLQIRHNAVIGLVNRAEARGLVRRMQDANRIDRRVVLIQLMAEGERILQAMAAALRSERRRVWTAMQEPPTPAGEEDA
ncbi:MAG: MarR family winged helix-turn-helix transcriptional regulator [Ktedonobacterales bacterium]